MTCIGATQHRLIQGIQLYRIALTAIQVVQVNNRLHMDNFTGYEQYYNNTHEITPTTQGNKRVTEATQGYVYV